MMSPFKTSPQMIEFYATNANPGQQETNAHMRSSGVILSSRSEAPSTSRAEM
jgi:hypothetical protein